MTRRWTKGLALIVVGGATMALVLLIPRSPTPRERVLSVHRPGTPNVGSALVEAADSANKANRHSEAGDLASKALAIRGKVYGAAHPALIRPLGIWADSLANLDRHAEAEPLARRGLAIAESNPDDSHYH